MKFTRRLAVIAAGALSVLVLPAAAVAAEPPPLPDHVPDAVASALFGGYQNWVGLNGPFTNPGDMIAYQQQGGEVYPVHPVISVSSSRYYFTHTSITISGDSWVPGSTVTGALVFGDGYLQVPVSMTASGQGHIYGKYVEFSRSAPFSVTLTNSYGQSATYSGWTAS